MNTHNENADQLLVEILSELIEEKKSELESDKQSEIKCASFGTLYTRNDEREKATVSGSKFPSRMAIPEELAKRKMVSSWGKPR